MLIGHPPGLLGEERRLEKRGREGEGGSCRLLPACDRLPGVRGANDAVFLANAVRGVGGGLSPEAAVSAASVVP